MIIRILALAAAGSLAAGGAWADGVAQATLQSPLAAPITLIAGDAQWTCQGATCTAPMAQEGVLTVQTCRTLAKATGAITAYSVDDRALPAPLLARCNAAIRPPESASAR